MYSRFIYPRSYIEWKGTEKCSFEILKVKLINRFMNAIKVKAECEIIVSPKMLQTLIKVGIAQNRDWIINYLTKALLGAELLTAKEVEDSMKFSRSTLYRWEKKGLITPMRYGRSKRYCKDELLKLKKYGR